MRLVSALDPCKANPGVDRFHTLILETIRAGVVLFWVWG